SASVSPEPGGEPHRELPPCRIARHCAGYSHACDIGCAHPVIPGIGLQLFQSQGIHDGRYTLSENLVACSILSLIMFRSDTSSKPVPVGGAPCTGPTSISSERGRKRCGRYAT